MQANANLVAEVQTVHGRLARAQEGAASATNRARQESDRRGDRLSPSREEWARMAREGTVSLRLPCASARAGARYSVHKPNHHFSSGSRASHEVKLRAELAGLTDAELDALDEAYERTHARTWSEIRGSCEGNQDFRDARDELMKPDDSADDRTPPAPPDPATLIGICRDVLLSSSSPHLRATMTHVAELRAAGAPSAKATGDEERVLFALSTSTERLQDEMHKTLGHDKTALALDRHVYCLDETVFDLRTPPAPQAEADEVVEETKEEG